MGIIVSCEELPWVVVSRDRLKLFGAGPKPFKIVYNRVTLVKFLT